MCDFAADAKAAEELMVGRTLTVARVRELNAKDYFYQMRGKVEEIGAPNLCPDVKTTGFGFFQARKTASLSFRLLRTQDKLWEKYFRFARTTLLSN